LRVVTEGTLLLADAESLRDLATYLRRAKRLDPDGAARLRGHGGVLAVYVSPLHGGGLPDVLGLRTFALDRPSQVDVVVPLPALTDRLARPADTPALPVPPVPAVGVSWAGVTPPRRGWTALGAVPSPLLSEVAEAGVAEVAAGVPDVAGARAVARLRAAVWARPTPLAADRGAVPGRACVEVPAGAAFAAEGLGFLDEGAVLVFEAGPWQRLSSRRGHVLVRRPLLG
jgi:hypothetical protein